MKRIILDEGDYKSLTYYRDNKQDLVFSYMRQTGISRRLSVWGSCAFWIPGRCYYKDGLICNGVHKDGI
jgi:hypothetical protein